MASVNRRVTIGGRVLRPGFEIPEAVLAEHGARLEAIGAIPRGSAPKANVAHTEPSEGAAAGDAGGRFFNSKKRSKED